MAGVLDREGNLQPRLSTTEAKLLLEGETITSGMIPKLESAVRAASAGVSTLVADGREEGALRALLREPDTATGTRIG